MLNAGQVFAFVTIPSVVTGYSTAPLVTIPVSRPAGSTNEPPIAESQTLTVEPDTPRLINLVVAAVNDPPTFAAGGDLTYPAGTTGVQIEQGWASLISGGPMEMDLVTFALTPSDPGGVLNTITLNAGGTLQIGLTGLSGTATVEVIATDSMGASSAPASFTVTVEADAPDEDLIFANSFEAQ